MAADFVSVYIKKEANRNWLRGHATTLFDTHRGVNFIVVKCIPNKPAQYEDRSFILFLKEKTETLKALFECPEAALMQKSDDNLVCLI
jgi:hypothetical protein